MKLREVNPNLVLVVALLFLLWLLWGKLEHADSELRGRVLWGVAVAAVALIGLGAAGVVGLPAALLGVAAFTATAGVEAVQWVGDALGIGAGERIECTPERLGERLPDGSICLGF